MVHPLRRFAALLLPLLLLIATAVAQEPPAPGFTLKGIDGRTVSLASCKGKVVLIDFWASWCPPCRRSIPAVEKTFERFRNDGLVVLGINVEGDPAAAAKFAAKAGIRYPVLLDDDTASRAYRVTGIPAIFIVAPDGMIAARFTGYQPGMEEEWARTIGGLLQAAPAGKAASQRK